MYDFVLGGLITLTWSTGQRILNVSIRSASQVDLQTNGFDP